MDSIRTPAALAGVLGGCLGLSCTQTEPVPQDPVVGAAPAVSRAEASAGQGTRLHWSLPEGARWSERVVERMTVTEHPRLPVADGPLSVESRVERFEVGPANGDGVPVTVTPVQLEVVSEEAAGRLVLTAESPLDAATPPFAVRQLAGEGVETRYVVEPKGGVVRVDELERRQRAIEANFDRLSAAIPAAARGEARRDLADAQANFAPSAIARGLRPPLPEAAIEPGGTWSHTMRVPSMFGATVSYALEYRLLTLEDSVATVAYSGRGTVAATPAMEAFIAESGVEVSGQFVVDAERGVLLSQQETLAMRVVFKPGPNAGAGGTMATRLESTRTRVLDPD